MTVLKTPKRTCVGMGNFTGERRGGSSFKGKKEIMGNGRVCWLGCRSAAWSCASATVDGGWAARVVLNSFGCRTVSSIALHLEPGVRRPSATIRHHLIADKMAGRALTGSHSPRAGEACAELCLRRPLMCVSEQSSECGWERAEMTWRQIKEAERSESGQGPEVQERR